MRKPNTIPTWRWGEHWISAVTPAGLAVSHAEAVTLFQKLAAKSGYVMVNPAEVVLVNECRRRNSGE